MSPVDRRRTVDVDVPTLLASDRRAQVTQPLAASLFTGDGVLTSVTG